MLYLFNWSNIYLFCLVYLFIFFICIFSFLFISLFLFIHEVSPPWGPGGLSRECAPPYPKRDRKRRLNGAVCRNHRIKGWSRVGARIGTLKNPTKCLWRWEPDRRSNFLFSPPAHLCAVTYMTEISLIVTLNNQFNQSINQPIMKFLFALMDIRSFLYRRHLLFFASS